MTNSRIEMEKWITFIIPDDPHCDKKDDSYYENLSRFWGEKFDKIARSIGKKYRVYTDIDINDGSLAYLSYDITYSTMVSDYESIDTRQISLDLQTIYVIISTLVEKELEIE